MRAPRIIRIDHNQVVAHLDDDRIAVAIRVAGQKPHPRRNNMRLRSLFSPRNHEEENSKHPKAEPPHLSIQSSPPATTSQSTNFAAEWEKPGTLACLLY